MPTWVIMMGSEAIIVIASIIAVVAWMKSGGEKEDAIDKRLKELSELNAAKNSTK